MDVFTAKYDCECPCGAKIKKGSLYCDNGRIKMCMECVFPEPEKRNLVLISRSVKK